VKGLKTNNQTKITESESEVETKLYNTTNRSTTIDFTSHFVLSSIAFTWIVTLWDRFHRNKSQNYQGKFGGKAFSRYHPKSEIKHQ